MMERSVSIIISFFFSSFWCVDHVAVYLNSSSFFFVRAFLYVSWEEKRSDWLRDRSPQRTTKTTTGKAYVWPPFWPKIKFIITIFSPFTNEMDRALCSFSPTWWLSLKRWLVQWNQIGIDEMELTKEGGERKLRKREKGGNQWRHRIEKMLATVEVCTREGERRP